MRMIGQDSLKTHRTLAVDGKTYHYFSLPEAAKTIGDLSRLPFSLKVLLENLLRFEDGRSVTKTTNISEQTMQKVDAEVRRIIDEQYGIARKLIEDNQDKMHAMAKALLEWETIDTEQIDDIMAGRDPRPPKDFTPRTPPAGGGSGGRSSASGCVRAAGGAGDGTCRARPAAGAPRCCHSCRASRHSRAVRHSSDRWRDPEGSPSA